MPHVNRNSILMVTRTLRETLLIESRWLHILIRKGWGFPPFESLQSCLTKQLLRVDRERDWCDHDDDAVSASSKQPSTILYF